MKLHALPEGDNFMGMSLLYMNDRGEFINPGSDMKKFSDAQTVPPEQLPVYLKKRIVLPKGVTDVFVWVHGWRNNAERAIATARRLFNGIVEVQRAKAASYANLSNFVPAFVAVHWPSMSRPTMVGYRSIRDRAAAMTEKGYAEFFLASLLGYLEGKNERGASLKVLRAKGGFYVHCLGHSFGGRFLTAAIRAAATPQSPQTLSLIRSAGAGARKTLSAAPANRFEFTVDSLLVFQMAAPSAGFGPELTSLINDAPLRGPVVLTHSIHDRANCLWHGVSEFQRGIGCAGATEPKKEIGQLTLGGLKRKYTPRDFKAKIVNVDATAAFENAGLKPEGAHSDFWYEESIHLALSLVDFVHN
jgi:hypothetical protein